MVSLFPTCSFQITEYFIISDTFPRAAYSDEHVHKWRSDCSRYKHASVIYRCGISISASGRRRVSSPACFCFSGGRCERSIQSERSTRANPNTCPSIKMMLALCPLHLTLFSAVRISALAPAPTITMSSSFAQVSSPTDVLKSILRSYPLGVGLLREIIQNSEDAKASRQVGGA